jgi:hypothetical protein
MDEAFPMTESELRQSPRFILRRKRLLYDKKPPKLAMPEWLRFFMVRLGWK